MINFRQGNIVGSKKTGRKKKSEFRKYKEHLNNLKKMETALATMRTIASTVMENAKLQAIGVGAKKFASGGIVKPSTDNEMVCKSGELVLSED